MGMPVVGLVEALPPRARPSTQDHFFVGDRLNFSRGLRAVVRQPPRRGRSGARPGFWCARVPGSMFWLCGGVRIGAGMLAAQAARSCPPCQDLRSCAGCS